MLPITANIDRIAVSAAVNPFVHTQIASNPITVARVPAKEPRKIKAGRSEEKRNPFSKTPSTLPRSASIIYLFLT
jgi:hypothetical protein